MTQHFGDFLKRTSLHGCERTTDNNKYTVSRFVWILFLMCEIVLFLYLAADLYIEYTKYKTKTKQNIQTLSTMPFPAVTICNLSPYTTSNVNVTPALENFLLSVNPAFAVYAEKINWSEPQYKALEEEDLLEWHDKASTKLDETFHECTLDSRSINCSDYFTVTETDIGRCFTFNRDGSITSAVSGYQSGLGVKVNIHQEHYIINTVLSAGIKVFLHEPDEEPSVYEKGSLIAPGAETYVQVHNRKFYFKPYPYKSSGDRYCLDVEAPDYVNTLKFHNKYSWFGCLYECMFTPIFNSCGCTHAGQAVRFNTTACNRRVILECLVANKSTNITEILEKCGCAKPCTQNQYYATISSAGSPSLPASHLLTKHSIVPSLEYARLNFIDLHVFFEELVSDEVIYEPEYTHESVMVSLGGYMGLFLGASILTILEITEFFISSGFDYIKHKLLCKNNEVKVMPKSSDDVK